jgi:aminoglycoside 2'-N-acetyltransferase I
MTELTVVHTADLDPVGLGEARAMTFSAFPEGEFTDHDWEHGLGGLHAVVRDGDTIVGHAALNQRHLVHEGRALRAGYVESVAVHPDHRRQGIGHDVIAALEPVIERAFDLGVLYATDAGRPLYLSRGWAPWEGRLFAFTPDGIVPTPDDEGGVLVFDTGALDLTADLTCDFRSGDLW